MWILIFVAGRAREKCQQHLCTILASQKFPVPKGYVGRKENVNSNKPDLIDTEI